MVQAVHHKLKEMPPRSYSGVDAEVKGVSGLASNDKSWLHMQGRIPILWSDS